MCIRDSHHPVTDQSPIYGKQLLLSLFSCTSSSLVQRAIRELQCLKMFFMVSHKVFTLIVHKDYKFRKSAKTQSGQTWLYNVKTCAANLFTAGKGAVV